MVACVCVTLGVLADEWPKRGSFAAIRRKLNSVTAVVLARGFFLIRYLGSADSLRHAPFFMIKPGCRGSRMGQERSKVDGSA